MFRNPAIGPAATFFPASSMESTHQSPQESLSLAVSAPSLIRAGRVIPIALRLVNDGDHPVTVQLTGRTMTFDVVIRDSAGRDVFRLLRSQNAAIILRRERFEVGESREMLYRWDQQTDDGRAARPGNYTIEALLPTAEEPVRAAQVPLRILPR
jgi:hypothetical protein